MFESVTLGRTGIVTTRAGLGCGGHSRIGLAKYGLEHAAGIVRAAFDDGVRFFDTAHAYGTQGAVGQGLSGIDRSGYVLSTKFRYRTGVNGLLEASELLPQLENALRELQTDYIDIYHLHGVSPQDYAEVRDRFYPELEKARAKGMIRHIGITELFAEDTSHKMLKDALADDLWDVVMVGHNLLNPSAERWVLPEAKKRGVATLCMFAVRTALSNIDMLASEIATMVRMGQIDPAKVRPDENLSFLSAFGVADSVVEAAYRYCLHTVGLDVILTGTGSRDHLADNLKSLRMPPLPLDTLKRIKDMFGNVDCVSGE